MKFLILFFTLLTFSAFSQVKQKTADKLFANMEYSKCVTMYDELAKKCAANHKKCALSNVRNAAVSHFKLFEMKKAISYFNQLKSSKLNETDYEYLIQALRFIGNYSEANNELKNALASYPSNSFFQTLSNEASKFNQLFTDSASFDINKTMISSMYGDFAPTFYQNGIVYATKSKNTEVLRGKYGWDNSYYISLMQSEFDQDSMVGNGKLLKHKFLSKAHDGPVDFSTNETQMVITKNTLGKKNGKDIIVLALYFSTFNDGKWGDLIPFEYNNPSYNVGHGSFSADGKKLYFSSDMPGSIGETDIYVSSFENGRWSTPVNLGASINTPKNELFPFVTADKIYLSSNGHFGLGGLDIFEASLEHLQPKNIGFPVNSSADDFSFVQDSAGVKGFFATNREDNIDQIYAFERNEVFADVIVKIFEKYNVNEIVPSHPFLLKNEKTNETDEYFTNNEGNLQLLVRQFEHYSLTTSKEDFRLLKPVELYIDKIVKDTTYECELILIPTKITIALRVISKETKKPIEEANATIFAFSSAGDTTMVTNENGLVTINVERNKEYVAHGSKKGFIDDQKSFNTSHQDGKIIELQLELTPIKKGEKFKLENIFYDLNKSTLRPESMASLDKLAEFIIKNDLSIELSAHTDARGSATYNQKLSQARAQSCVDYLLTKGLNKNQIRAKGYGESQLVNRCKDNVKCSEEEHQENRRTEVKILEYKQD